MRLALLPEVLAVGLAAAFLAGAFLRIEPRTQAALLVFVLLGHAALLLAKPANQLLSDSVVLVSAAMTGVWVARMASSGRRLVSLAVALALLDAVASLSGLTGWVVEAASGPAVGAAHYLAVTLPLAFLGSIPVAGWGHLVVLAAIYAALRGMEARVLVAAAVPLVGLVTALGMGLARGGALAIPFMAAATIAYLALTGRLAETSGGSTTYDAPEDGDQIEPNQEQT